jgi:hypothetical protein
MQQDNKINQKDEQGRAQGYWHQTTGILYYKGNYVDNEMKGLFEDNLGKVTIKQYQYHAK